MTNSTSGAILENLQYCFEYVNESCPKAVRSTGTQATLYVFLMMSILVTVFGNSIVIISISYFRQLQTPTNYLVLSLAIADFLVGFLVMPYSMVRSIETCWYFGSTFCKIHSSLDMMMSTTSIFHLCFIAIDRCCAVCDPLLYLTKITPPVITIFVTVSWVIPALFAFGVVFSEINLVGIEDLIASSSCVGSCVLLFNKLWGVLAPTISFFIPGAIMLSIYIKIFFVASKHARVIGNTNKETSSTEENKSRISRSKENKAAKTLGIVMGIFLTCWIPFFITTVIDPIINFSTLPIIFDTFVWFGYFNSAFNPMLYAFFYPWFRKSLKLILTWKILNSDSSTINLFSE
ncbi:trace amine-associated receptor 4-like [Mustelus asterias]